MALRVGVGFDSHRLAPGRPLLLGGVRIPHDRGLVGHSDGDVVIHAVIDALLGAAGRGNIGEWFPDTDEAFAGADSAALLARVWEDLAQRGWRLVNLDCVVVAQRPRLTPHLRAIQERLAGLLGCPRGNVSVKPKTADALGLLERGEGMAAFAVVLVEVGEPAGAGPPPAGAPG